MTKVCKITSIKCADCLHCKQLRVSAKGTGRYVLKAGCNRGHWDRGGRAGSCELHRVLGRRVESCPDYESMSDNEEERRESLQELSASMPKQRLVYEADGSVANLGMAS